LVTCAIRRVVTPGGCHSIGYVDHSLGIINWMYFDCKGKSEKQFAEAILDTSLTSLADILF
jgi:hypothetical protein